MSIKRVVFRSLVLGSAAAIGLSAGAYAADPNGLLASLDTCDDQGKTGLTISSEDNCLVVDGEISYEFVWGDYAGVVNLFGPFGFDGATYFVAANNDGVAPATQDWGSDVNAFIRFSASATSDFGPAMAVIKIKDRQRITVSNEAAPVAHADDTGGVIFDEAYVSVGDATVISAGRKGSIINKGDDEPFEFKLFHSEAVDHGVIWSVPVADGGHVIQIVSDLGNGVTVKGGLENLNGDGTAVGVLEYAGDSFAGHATIIATDVLDGAVTDWAYHVGGTATLDIFRIRGAVAGDDTGYWNALASVAATVDMFTVAGSVEGVHTAGGMNQFGYTVGARADVTDMVSVVGAFRWFDPDTAVASDEGWQTALGIIVALTENIVASGEIGFVGTGAAAFTPNANVTYGKAELAWAPGGAFTSSIAGEMNSEGAYKFTYKAAKTFK